MLRLKALGHACFMLSTEKYSVIFDPWLQDNPEAVCGPGDVEVDAILVSHGHSDHLGDAIPISLRLGVPIIAPYELAMYCARFGCETAPMHIGGGRQFEFGHVKLTQAFHGSAIVNDDRIEYTGMPCGFVVTMNGTAVYYAGDTGLFSDMKLIGELNDLRVAILPIGDNFTMGPTDALVAAEMLKPDLVVPMHYSAFEVIRQDVNRFAQELRERSLDCLILRPGQEEEV
jgi:L-ascorbate metabolism protein UlaG (beta-lactamase superfamily)